jgi:large subunit ribosomal protein L18
MTRGKVRIIGHRRRREQRTDFRHRLGLIRSGKPRLVVRRTLKSMSCQIMEHNPKGDRAIVTVTSRDLKGFGWKGIAGNIPSAYLTGMLCGIQAKKKGVKEAVLDTGLQTSTKGSRIYSCLKGVVDAGIDVPHSPDVIPPVERIRGLHIEEYSKSRGKLAGVSGMFDEVKKAISSGTPKGTPHRAQAGKHAPAKASARKASPKKDGSQKKPAKKAPAKKAKTGKK